MKDNNFLKLCLLLLIVFTTSNTFSQNTVSNQEQLIKECLIFKPLQDKIPLATKSQIETYYVLINDLNVKLSSISNVKGMPISLITDNEINETISYYKFNLIRVDGDKAIVRFSLFFKDNGITKKIQAHIEFGKFNSVWEETNSHILN